MDLPTLPTYLFQPTLVGALSLVLTFLLPIIAALVMKASWSNTLKGVILLAVAAVKTILEAWLAAESAHLHFDMWGIAYTVVINFGIAVLSYFGFLKGGSVQQGALHGGIVRDRTPIARR